MVDEGLANGKVSVQLEQDNTENVIDSGIESKGLMDTQLIFFHVQPNFYDENQDGPNLNKNDREKVVSNDNKTIL